MLLERNSLDLPIRADLRQAYINAWRHIAQPGTWWDSATRLAIAAETRHALHCPLCARRKAALSPASEVGRHESLGELPNTVVEVVHRVRTDSGRLTSAWFEQCTSAGLSEAAYVEVVAIVATTAALDTLSYALGAELEPLPQSIRGEPSRHLPADASKTIAWVPTLEPGDVTDQDPDPYPGKTPELVFNVHRALSLVPTEAAAFFSLDDILYLPQHAIRDFSTEYRHISHAQMELLAARVSAINQCTY